MFKNRSLKAQFQITFSLIILASVLATIITFAAAGIAFLLLQYKILYPANYYEKKLPAIAAYIQQQNTSLLSPAAKSNLEKVIPLKGINYQVLDGDGRFLYGTSHTKVIASRQQLYSRLNTTSEFQGTYILTVPIIRNDARISGAVLLFYKLKVTSSDDTIQLWIFYLFILTVISPFLYILLFTFLFSKKLTKEIRRPLEMLMAAAQKIREKDLDFHIDYHAKNEVGKLCDAFTGMQKELKDSLFAQWRIEQERTEMVEAMAHDLKTPMSVIQGYAEALLDAAPDEQEKAQKYLSVIQDNAKKASNLVQKMQYSSELERSGSDLNVQEVNLVHFLEQKGLHYEMQAKQKRIEITVDLQELKETAYRIDQEKLERVLDNIVFNSLQYTPDGGRVIIAVKGQPDTIRFKITDSGPGFRPKDLPSIFEKFYRSDAARGNSSNNSGLGLYIARQLVRKQGGVVEASNIEPHGACVTFTVKPLQR